MAAHDDDMYDRQMGAQRKEQKTFKGLFQGEIYAKAERAAPGEAFPAKQDSSIIPIQDIFREIKEEEEQDAHRLQVKQAMARGQIEKQLGPVNPWDRDGKKAEKESTENMLQEAAAAEQKRLEEHYLSGAWKKNHPHHHHEWLSQQSDTVG
ncbi:hypothetical protein CYMTET_25698 [Cymbomonas tetramitiformis]|uniref:Uncharacterized protein n=1 Tax=Cymbomonas tetramitiformis TaxID=36881 RepID=A0AAE0FTP3_9CHLO|nr:hypothetical protein CYMTET_25698 [Cymbomonas tetramitiformis]